MIALAIGIALVAIVVPACRMIGCTMNGSGMAWGDRLMEPGFFGTCGGELTTNTTPVAVVPLGAEALALALASAFIAAIVLFRPPVLVQTVTSHSSDPPPPPEDPRGERLLI